MAAYNKVPGSREAIAEQINVGSDQWAICLSNTAPTSTAFTAGTTDLATGGGYTAGGKNVATISAAETGGIYRLVLADPTLWTATGSDMGPLRYALLVDKTVNLVVGYWDRGSSVTLSAATADTFAVDLDGTNGGFTLS